MIPAIHNLHGYEYYVTSLATHQYVAFSPSICRFFPATVYPKLAIFVETKTKIYFMSTNSVSLHRVIKAKPAKVFRAFTNPLALAAWIPPYGFLCTVHEMDAKAGGQFRMSFTNFSTGNAHSFGGKYVEFKENELLKYTDQFDDPNLPGEMTTTVWFKEVICGTEIKIVQEGIPAVIPAEMCYLGWQESLEKLMKLVEPEIPDGA